MPQIRISVEAEADIDRIADYTTSTWGLRQTNQYLAKLEDGFDLLAQNPGRHVVFYLPEPGGVLVVRVLHQQMLPSNYV